MSCALQEDLKKFFSEPQPPPSGIEIPKEGKAKERREVGEGNDTVIVEDTTDDDDDDETLQDCFQLRSRFSRPGLPHVPLVQDPRLAWGLTWLRHHVSRATPPASGWQRSSRSRRPRLRR
jgi:hypothetical protein